MANIQILNDTLHCRLFMDYQTFSDKISRYKVIIDKIEYPLLFLYPMVKDKNYYTDWLKIFYDLV